MIVRLAAIQEGFLQLIDRPIHQRGQRCNVLVAGKAARERGFGHGREWLRCKKGAPQRPARKKRMGIGYCWMQLSMLSAVHSSRPV
jgi:hypothetical protein